MKVLSMGLPYGTPGEPHQYFQSQRGHDLRTLSLDDTGDFRYDATETTQAILDRIAAEFTPDLLICWCPEVIPPPLAIESASVTTVAVVSDWTIYHSALQENLKRFNLVIMDKLAHTRQPFDGIHTHYLGPLYSQRTGVHRHLNRDRDLDIVFVGNLNHATHRERGYYLERIAKLADRYRVVIASGMNPEDYTTTLNRAKIVFNYGLRQEMNLRAFEALTCGALLFMEEENLEVGEMLTPNETVVLYDQENLEDKLDWWLTHDDERNAVAKQGLERAATLAGEHRLDDFIEQLAALSPTAETFTALDERTRLLAEMRFYASSPHPGHTAHSQASLEQALAAYTDDPETRYSQAIALLDQFNAGENANGAKEALVLLHQLTQAHPEEATLWMCMAQIAKQAEATKLEIECYQSLFKATTLHFGALLPGKRNDPWYGHWQNLLAYNQATLEYLREWALYRLGAINLEWKKLEALLEFTAFSEASLVTLAAPHALLGKAYRALGHLEASIAAFEKGLPLTALDSTHRNELIDTYILAGRNEDALALAQESATIFHAWWGAEAVSQAFQERVQALSPKE